MPMKIILFIGVLQIVCHAVNGQMREVEGPIYDNFNESRTQNYTFSSEDSSRAEANTSKTVLEPIEKQNLAKINYTENENSRKKYIFKGNQEESRQGADTKPQAQQKWKVMAHTLVKDFKDNTTTRTVEAKINESTNEEFKPSPELGAYYDLDSYRNPLDYKINNHQYFAPMEVTKSPNSQHGNNYNGDYNLKHNNFVYKNERPQEESKYGYQKHKSRNRFKSHPYEFDVPKFESYEGRNFRGKQQDSKPTIESSVAIPAGGLYQLPHSLYAVQNEYQEVPNEEVEQEYEHRPHSGQSKERKKPNPWKNVVGLLTTILPIGLLISALTPSVITVDSAATGGSILSKKRSIDGEVSNACMERLLCELQNAERLKNNVRNNFGLPTSETVIETPDLPASSSSQILQSCTKHECNDPTIFTGSVNKGRVFKSPSLT